MTNSLMPETKPRLRNKLIDDAKMEEIITDLYKAHSLTKTLKDHGVGAESFFTTLREVPLHAQSYQRAQDSRADIYADEIIDIADTENDPQKARNRIEARKWATSKMKPSVYGDRIDLNINQTVDIIAALNEAKSRIRDVIQLPDMQVPEITGTNNNQSLEYETNAKPETESEAFKKLLGFED